MAPSFEPQRRRSSLYQQRRLSVPYEQYSWSAPPSGTVYAGLSALFSDDGLVTVALAIRDVTYLLDFVQQELKPKNNGSSCAELGDFVINQLQQYSERHMEKFIGVAMPQRVADACPGLSSRLWAELDVLPLVLREESRREGDDKFAFGLPDSKAWKIRSIDEQAESMGRKCVRLFGPDNLPLLQVGFLGLVEVDTAFHVRLANLGDFQKTVTPKTWNAVQHYATDLKQRKVKIAFFSATPQGGGVALMRHALVRFSHSLGTDIAWYVPKPRPGVFRVTKTNHNILQGVSQPGERLTEENWGQVVDWINENAKRYWLVPGGPLLHPSEGGADVVIIDDPQMPALIPIAKKIAPDRPVIFRSHIHIRSDLISQPGTPQEEAWARMWEPIKSADIYISQPVRKFVPHNVPQEKVGYMPASTDWLDGLNKHMRDWDVAYYGRSFNATCRNSGMPTIDYPKEKYIAQIARFDPSKGIPEVMESYVKFHERFTASVHGRSPPKLLICGHGSVDDPDGSVIYDAVVSHIEENLAHLADQICVVRLGSSDQLLNALLSKTKVALQLSTHEGFEVKVSEAIHKGVPVIATRAGGIPLQVADQENGFLVDVGDTDSVAQHLYDLCTDEKMYQRMSQFARENVCDEVSTVGNALNWLYLASTLTGPNGLKPNGRWINDLARNEAGQPYTEGEPMLKRAIDLEKMG
ncbi:UDP-Glycosyltransferase/glycogen phosphorylase [Aspergillus steynii IBT 23096]|uniref:UDP-Glycosyltransferase/glycogen phosphorylase n=1 Tax=Aspergillus steynii IBT 23096 TaxID=1392250 RepID=A0A2I2GIT7_9EURO|nr:UDP-Glycosyltransferase/glycogen phosphorylase [Aspergillus steynii IBT 23096]PLB52794.1 UDP-Glycosyltransferase/glycogen phosphorylase [Aspergillus steynii IBT 23096]